LIILHSYIYIYLVFNKYSAFFGFTLGLGLLNSLKPIVEGNNRIAWVHIPKTWFGLVCFLFHTWYKYHEIGDCVSMNEELHHIERTFALGVKDFSVELPNAMH
jgi:hypothetical protein